MLWRLSRLELRSGRKMSGSGSLELMSEKSERSDISDQPESSVLTELTISSFTFICMPGGPACSYCACVAGSGCSNSVEKGFLTGLKLLSARAASREVRVIFLWDLQQAKRKKTFKTL